MIKRRPVPGVVSDPRSWGLFAVSLVYVSRGIAYTFTKALEPLPYGLDVLVLYVSIKTYGVLWLIGAAAGVWMALWRVRKIWAVALMSAMPTLWGIAYCLSWILSGFSSNSWTGTFLFGCFSVITVAFGVQQPQKVVFFRGSNRSGTD